MKSSAALLLLMLGVTCGRGDAQTTPLPPPYAGAYQPQGVDEIGMWREDDESERQLAVSNLVVRDEKLTAYVKQVLCDTVGEDRCKSVRVYIVREPTFNATMSPNGTMRVFSGLFLRVHSEAELAAVLGHEFGHFEQRHSLADFKSLRSGTDVLAWTAVLVNLAASYNTRRVYRDVELSVYGHLYRYNRDQEREADRLGIAYLNKSRLRPQAASLVWQNIMAEVEVSARHRGLKKPNFNAIAFTATHPPHGERANYLSVLALPEGADRDSGADRYRAMLAPWIPLFLEDQVRLNDFGGSEYLIETLAQAGWTAGLWFARGELYRNRGNQRDLVQAADFYARAIEMESGMADAHRGLGLSLMKAGRPSDGQKALQAYLDLKPGASDANMIRMMLPKEVTGP
jgi:Zn-dependent protease with chaperone function